MTNEEEQKLLHAVSGLAQGVQALLVLLTEAGKQRAHYDEEILNVLKMISRKH